MRCFFDKELFHPVFTVYVILVDSFMFLSYATFGRYHPFLLSYYNLLPFSYPDNFSNSLKLKSL